MSTEHVTRPSSASSASSASSIGSLKSHESFGRPSSASSVGSLRSDESFGNLSSDEISISGAVFSTNSQKSTSGKNTAIYNFSKFAKLPEKDFFVAYNSQTIYNIILSDYDTKIKQMQDNAKKLLIERTASMRANQGVQNQIYERDYIFKEIQIYEMLNQISKIEDEYNNDKFSKKRKSRHNFFNLNSKNTFNEYVKHKRILYFQELPENNSTHTANMERKRADDLIRIEQVYERRTLKPSTLKPSTLKPSTLRPYQDRMYNKLGFQNIGSFKNLLNNATKQPPKSK